jgi:hypothetical protein
VPRDVDSEARKSLRNSLEDGRPLYEAVRRRLENVESVVAILKELQVYLEPILSAQRGQQPHELAWVVAQTQANLASFFNDFDGFLSYVEKMERMVDLDKKEKASRSPNVDFDPLGVGLDHGDLRGARP